MGRRLKTAGPFSVALVLVLMDSPSETLLTLKIDQRFVDAVCRGMFLGS
jgi:hypothetical protein